MFEPMTIGGKVFDFSHPYVMGILNVTPDSFSDGGKFFELDRAVARALEMIQQGAEIIDVGGESTRPGAEKISIQEEIDRVIPVIEALKKRSDIPVSIDTTKSQVAREALKVGASLINDISGLRFDPRIASVAAEYDAALVIMHSRKTPANMQQSVHYDDLFGEVIEELRAGIAKAMECGVNFTSIIVDPGIGFAKQPHHNVDIMANLDRLKVLKRPILVGPSRKSFIEYYTGASVSDRLGGTASAIAISVLNGANFIRVHDVDVMRQAAVIAHEMKKLRH